MPHTQRGEKGAAEEAIGAADRGVKEKRQRDQRCKRQKTRNAFAVSPSKISLKEPPHGTLAFLSPACFYVPLIDVGETPRQ